MNALSKRYISISIVKVYTLKETFLSSVENKMYSSSGEHQFNKCSDGLSIRDSVKELLGEK